MLANWENSAVATGLEKVSFLSNPKEGQCQRLFKLLYNCTNSHASKVILKVLQARLQQYVNSELPDIQAGFRKGRGTRDQIANICWIIEKARKFQKKTSTSASLTMLKPLTVWVTTNCGKFLKRWNTRPLYCLLRPLIQVKKQQLEPATWNNRLIQNWERSTWRLYIVTLLM